MQGFGMGRYRPPDSDPTKTSFNSNRHPLGDRARKISEGILIVRFELPFNIWCGGCQNHIGQGVRYNAEKKQVGEYYTTKIWSFRCKCHLCSHWFEIRTEPKNARYTVHEGARKQNQEWKPEENGGDDAESSTDPFANLEKRETERQKAIRTTARVLEIEEHNEPRWSDPYTLNSKIRNTFRKEKRVRTAQLEKDLEMKKRIGWREDAKLANEDGGEKDKGEWKEEKLKAQQRRLEQAGRSTTDTPCASDRKARSSSSNPPSAADRLRRKLVANTRSKQDPFLQQVRSNLKPK